MQNQQNCNNSKITSFTQLGETLSPPSTPRFGGEEIRVVESMIDIIFPPVPFPSNRIFKALGEEKIRDMVRYHHALLLKTTIKTIFPSNPEALNLAIEKSADFFVEALGGGDVFTSQHGEPHLRMRHFKVPITENDREIWLAMYKKTLKEITFPKELLEEFWNWIEPLSIRMINRRTNMSAIPRHYWHTVKKEF
ncbi:globin [Sulfurimonas sp.]|uniref:globin domain-containing protein n=1 Tax=Sulfurimonas sp. TaxID=2022749 RepID=UPI003D0F2991